jgi:amino acid adenylation domain-containing protein
VFKASAAYVPLDPAYPSERLSYMLEDSAPALLLVDDTTVALWPESATEQSNAVVNMSRGDTTRIWNWQRGRGQLASADGGAPSVAGSPEQLAYVIYTSGSTGLPKGVMITHGNLLNFVRWYGDAFGMTPRVRSSCLAALGFDAAACEIWGTLCAGGQLCLPSAATASEPERLLEWWRSEPLDVTVLPTPLAEVVIARRIGNARVRSVVTGGDRWIQELPQNLTFDVVNNYGPTETTIVASSGRLEPGAAPVHIGRPIHGARVYVLSAAGEPLPAGVIGELYVAGAGVGPGYLARPELTAERFVPDAFAPEPGARMYRTGDLGRYSSDATIECLGRLDSQVKIRGYRIELGEIEAALVADPRVHEGVVVARDDCAGSKRLVAYYTGEPRSGDAIRAHLAGKLPGYMLPSSFVWLERLPLTPNGKVDRRALPDPEHVGRDERARSRLPQGQLERDLAEAWSSTLELDEIGVDDNFFECGGNSLSLLKLRDNLNQRLQRELPLVLFFQFPTVRTLAEHLAAEFQVQTTILTPLEQRRAALRERRQLGRRRRPST